MAHGREAADPVDFSPALNQGQLRQQCAFVTTFAVVGVLLCRI